jgi:hypothetical protein
VDDVASWLFELLDEARRLTESMDRDEARRRALVWITAERRIVERCFSVHLLAEVEPETYRNQAELAELVLADLAWGHRYDADGWRPEWAVTGADIRE